MHSEQLHLEDELAARLIAEQFPALSGRPLRRQDTPATVNAIFRIGEDLVARFPLLPTPEADLRAQAAALTALGAVSPVPVPKPFGVGSASAEYASAFAVQTWVPGVTATSDGSSGSKELAADVAGLIAALRSVPPGGRVFDGRGRGGRIRDHDEWMRLCCARSAHIVDVDAVKRLWDAVRDLPPSGPDVMSHRDLTPPNLLVGNADGPLRLVGVLDGGDFGPADPALDLVVAWHVFDAPAREVIRARVDAGRTEWLRGAAWALQQAMGLGWYYEDSNPVMSALGVTTVRRLLSDPELAVLV